jgi:hypothetical protein
MCCTIKALLQVVNGSIAEAHQPKFVLWDYRV